MCPDIRQTWHADNNIPLNYLGNTVVLSFQTLDIKYLSDRNRSWYYASSLFFGKGKDTRYPLYTLTEWDFHSLRYLELWNFCIIIDGLLEHKFCWIRQGSPLGYLKLCHNIRAQLLPWGFWFILIWTSGLWKCSEQYESFHLLIYSLLRFTIFYFLTYRVNEWYVPMHYLQYYKPSWKIF